MDRDGTRRRSTFRPKRKRKTEMGVRGERRGKG